MIVTARRVVDQDDAGAEPILARDRAQQHAEIDDRHDFAPITEESGEGSRCVRDGTEFSPGHELDHPCHIHRVPIPTGCEGQEEHWSPVLDVSCPALAEGRCSNVSLAYTPRLDSRRDGTTEH